MDPWKIRVNGMQTEVAGGSVVWNQFANLTTSGWSAASAITLSIADQTITLTSNTDSTATKRIRKSLIETNKYFVRAYISTSGTSMRVGLYNGNLYTAQTDSFSVNTPSTLYETIINANVEDPYFGMYIATMAASGNGGSAEKLMLINLTRMFGATIADHILALETATPGAGVAFFREMFPDEYYPYNAGELLSRSVDDIALRGMPALEDGEIVFPDADVYSNSGEILRNWDIRAYESGDESDPDVMTDGTNTLYKLLTPATEQGPSWTIPQALQEGSLETIRLFDPAPSSAFISFGADVRSLVIGCWYTPETAITAADTGNSWPAGAPARLTDFGYHDDGSCWARTSSGRFEIGNSKILNLWRVNN